MAQHSRCFLLMLLLAASAVLAEPKDREGPPTLDITSSVELGHPLFGDKLGPFPPSISVTLICSTTDSTLVLSWWRAGQEMASQDVNVGDQGTGRPISLEALSVSDNGLQLTCKAEGTPLEKTVTLQVEETDVLELEKSDSLEAEKKESLEVTGTLEILANGKSLEKEQVTVDVKDGDDLELTCVLQEYNTPAVSWFDGDKKLDAESEQSSYAASSVLAIPAVSLVDSGRRFSCRSEDGARERALEILVTDSEFFEGNTLEVLQIALICICVGGVLLIIGMALVVVRLVREYKEAVRCQQVSKVSDIFKKYSRLPNVNGSSQNVLAPHLVRGPYKPCTVLIDPEGSE